MTGGVFSDKDGALEIDYASRGIVPLFGRKLPVGDYVQQILPLADGRALVLSSTGPESGLLVSLVAILLGVPGVWH